MEPLSFAARRKYCSSGRLTEFVVSAIDATLNLRFGCVFAIDNPIVLVKPISDFRLLWDEHRI